jgi:hypothetical protein
MDLTGNAFFQLEPGVIGNFCFIILVNQIGKPDTHSLNPLTDEWLKDFDDVIPGILIVGKGSAEEIHATRR